MKVSKYEIESRFSRDVTALLLADLHSIPAKDLVKKVEKESPDMILIPGDWFENLNGSLDEKYDSYAYCFETLAELAKLAPTFYSLGNHETGGIGSGGLGIKKKRGLGINISPENLEKLEKTRVTPLFDGFCESSLGNGERFLIGGISSGLTNDDGEPKLDWLDEFNRADKELPKILLCHHPEYYPRYLTDIDADLVVSGHAHGGQWRIFGQGIFAPGQGLFPKYTSGVHFGNLVISRGLSNSAPIPRFFNPTEIVSIKLKKKKGYV